MSKYFFLTLYVALVVVFAVIYAGLPGHFFHASSSKENAFTILKSEADRSILRMVFPSPAVSRFTVDGLVYLIKPPALLDRVWIDGETLKAVFYLEVYPDPSHGTLDSVFVDLNEMHMCAVTIETKAPVNFRHLEPGEPLIIGWTVARVDPPLTDEALRVFGKWERSDNGKPMRFSNKATHDALVRFTLGSQGIPTGTVDHFSRMLYFSMTTIATVGYGDIIPVTGLARGLAGLEVFLGLLLLGAFFSSLSRK